MLRSSKKVSMKLFNYKLLQAGSTTLRKFRFFGYVLHQAKVTQVVSQERHKIPSQQKRYFQCKERGCALLFIKIN